MDRRALRSLLRADRWSGLHGSARAWFVFSFGPNTFARRFSFKPNSIGAFFRCPKFANGQKHSQNLVQLSIHLNLRQSSGRSEPPPKPGGTDLPPREIRVAASCRSCDNHRSHRFQTNTV